MTDSDRNYAWGRVHSESYKNDKDGYTVDVFYEAGGSSAQLAQAASVAAGMIGQAANDGHTRALAMRDVGYKQLQGLSRQELDDLRR